MIERVKIDSSVHGHLIGAKGKKLNQLQNQLDVTVWFPKPENKTGLVVIGGRKENVEKAKSRLLSLAAYFMQRGAIRREISGMRACKNAPVH